MRKEKEDEERQAIQAIQRVKKEASEELLSEEAKKIKAETEKFLEDKFNKM